ncbi:hypothetical protein EXIGLDRAFT_575058, partial [Exidia glandulosa HHB12029]
GVEHPWWMHFPHIDICRILCNDNLHGLHKAFHDHTMEWHTNMIGAAELDRRFQCIPRTTPYCCFDGGISKISQWSGKDARNVERYLLPAIAGISPPEAVRATRAELDFIYTAQWRSIEVEALSQLTEYNEIWHNNKAIFIDPELGGRRGSDGNVIPHFNIPKYHARHHFPDNILYLGTMDNYSAEVSERYHIEYIKDAYAATNRKDVHVQIIRCLNRHEKVFHYDSYQTWV